jgi:hypothetical protein
VAPTFSESLATVARLRFVLRLTRLVLERRAPVGRRLHLRHSTMLRGWHSTAGALPSCPMPPFALHQSVRKSRPSGPGWLALATWAGANTTIDTDVLSAGFASLLPAGHLRR